MSLTSILNEIEKNRDNANMDVTLGNPATYTGRLGLKRAATEAMKRLTLDYRNELMETAVFIVVTGPGREAFTELATKEPFNCFSNDPDNFYDDIVKRIEPKLFGRESTAGLFGIASRVLYDKAMELDLGSYNDVSFSEKYNRGVKTPEDLVAILKAAVNDQMGAEVVGINAIHQVVEEAVKRKHAGDVAPIILSTPDENFAVTLFKNLPELVRHGSLSDTEHQNKKAVKAHLVVAGKASKTLNSIPGAILVKTLTEESVGNALDTIRNKVVK